MNTNLIHYRDIVLNFIEKYSSTLSNVKYIICGETHDTCRRHLQSVYKGCGSIPSPKLIVYRIYTTKNHEHSHLIKHFLVDELTRICGREKLINLNVGSHSSGVNSTVYIAYELN